MYTGETTKEAYIQYMKMVNWHSWFGDGKTLPPDTDYFKKLSNMSYENWLIFITLDYYENGLTPPKFIRSLPLP